MARPAADPRPFWARDPLGLWTPSPDRLGVAARQALICGLTALAAQTYRIPDPALTVYLVFFLNRIDRLSSLVLNIATVVLVSIVLGLVLLTAKVVADHAAWRVLAIALLSFSLLFLASASKLRPVGATLALIVGYALDKLGTIQFGELATRALLFAWLFVAIPAGVSALVNLTLAPSPRKCLQRALAERLWLCARLLERPEPAIRARFDNRLEAGDAELRSWLKLARVEHLSRPAELAALDRAIASTTSILLAVDLTLGEADGLPDPLGRRLSETLDQMAAILARGGYPLEARPDLKGLIETLPPLAAEVVGQLSQALDGFAETSGDPAPPAPREAHAAGFWLPDAFTNPDHVHYALKTTGAALFCYLLYTLLDWPGVHTCFITCYIVALTTTGETVEKLTLRIVGCLIGAGVGIAAIVYVIPDLTSIGALLILVLAGGFAAAWIAAGGPRIAYAGFQIAFAFFICILQEHAPGTDLVLARDRVIGILIGNLVSYVVFTRLWPVSVAPRLDRELTGLARALAALAGIPQRGAREMAAAQALAQCGALNRDLELLAYEPRPLRPERAWVEPRQAALEGLKNMIAPLALAPGRIADEIAARLSRAAEHLDTGPARGEVPGAGAKRSVDGATLNDLVRTRLSDVEAIIGDERGVRP